MNCSLLLIRHGATAWNREGRYQGHSDPPLSRAGRRQAARLARALAHLRLDAVYSSDLSRARETASSLGTGVRCDPRLRELHFGRWEGLTAHEIDPALWQAWWSDPAGRPPPGGETTAALWARLQAALQEIGGRHGGTVAVVTHGGPLRLVLERLGLSGHIPNGGWLLLTSPVARRLW